MSILSPNNFLEQPNADETPCEHCGAHPLDPCAAECPSLHACGECGRLTDIEQHESDCAAGAVIRSELPYWMEE